MQVDNEHERLRWRVLDALYWDGDNAAAAQAVRELHRHAAALPVRSVEDREAQLRDLCAEQQWRLVLGDAAGASSAIRRFRTAFHEGAGSDDSVRTGSRAAVCATVLETWLAVLSKRSDATLLLNRLDSLSLSGAVDPEVTVALPLNLVVARLREAVNDPRGALAAILRRSYGFQPWYLSTCLREEGRLSALTGDTAAGIKAYRHYLALRSDPEPGLRSKVERVRTDLAALVAEP